jgi:hypothetical protein
MAEYRVEHLDLSTRIEIGLKMLLNREEREWGWITKTAEVQGVSRQTFYTCRDKVQVALVEALQPKAPGPQSVGQPLQVDATYIKWATTVLAMLKGSTRDIQLGLALLFGEQRSVGFISETINAVGQSATAYNAQLVPRQPIAGEIDEVFQGMRPCFTVVDGRSFMVLNLTAEENREGKTWAKTLQRLREQGVEFQDIVSDNASGIRLGVKEAGLGAIWRLDIFHVVHDGHRISQTLENAAYRAIKQAVQTQAHAIEQVEGRKCSGRMHKATGLSVAEANAQQDMAIEQYDLWTWLFSEVRFALTPVHGYRINDSSTARETLLIACDLMQQSGQKAIISFATMLRQNLEALLDPLCWLEEQVADWQHTLDPEDEALIMFVHRWPTFSIADLPPALQDVAQVYEKALALFHRASSHAESFHSWLRPYLDIHRTLPDWLLPLATLFWNHHEFQRGKRAGHSPVALAGIEDASSLHVALRQVFNMAFVGPDCSMGAAAC